LDKPQPWPRRPEHDLHAPTLVCYSTGTIVPRNMAGTWRIRDHEHNQQITIQHGDIFPACRLCGHAVTWCLVH